MRKNYYPASVNGLAQARRWRCDELRISEDLQMNLDLDKPPRAMLQEMGESFGKLRAYGGPHLAAVDSGRWRAKRRRGGNLTRGLAARRAHLRELMAGILDASQD